ncbi:sensor histidine kinase [Culicoidibacter larvae]|uniref:histidine kinase n=1 Tax=Culicoidibacter larvae TaxID=2579976 RepID=A0A5R8QAQ3_9FIRM|nr:HAMP domain-containing sensor histidine kinase [Culicoidibacter larvae]TLG72681.1 HAMP domain-containing histidine kinase [Culicoidibacter larvae]
MSGQNKNKRRSKKWRTGFYAISVFYLLLVMVLATVIYNIPGIYAYFSSQRIDVIRNEVEDAFKISDAAALASAFELIDQKNSIELVVKQGNNLVFSTNEETNFAELSKVLGEDSLSYQSAFQINSDSGTYQVWLGIYKFESQGFFELIMSIVIGTVIILCLIITILVVIIFRKLIMPLRRLQKNILNLKEYRFSEVAAPDSSTEYDSLSEDLGEFSEDLQEKIESIDEKYTRLELELQRRQERIIYQSKLGSALVHDLKTPINVSMLYVERIQDNIDDNPEISRLLERLVKNDELLLNQVNETLQVINTEAMDMVGRAEDFDVVPVVRETLALFTPFFEQHNIEVFLETPQSLIVHAVRLEFKQIIHNIISNASQYADGNGKFELFIDTKDNALKIIAYNDKQDRSNIDFDRIFDLFYRADSNGNNVFGSGVGMHTIKSMAEEYKGTCSFEAIGNGVQLNVVLPILADTTSAVKTNSADKAVKA